MRSSARHLNGKIDRRLDSSHAKRPNVHTGSRKVEQVGQRLNGRCQTFNFLIIGYLPYRFDINIYISVNVSILPLLCIYTRETPNPPNPTQIGGKTSSKDHQSCIAASPTAGSARMPVQSKPIAHKRDTLRDWQQSATSSKRSSTRLQRSDHHPGFTVEYQGLRSPASNTRDGSHTSPEQSTRRKLQ